MHTTIYIPFGRLFSSSCRRTRSDFAHNVEVCLAADRYCVETVAHLGEMQCNFLMFFQHGREIASYRLAFFLAEPKVGWYGWRGARIGFRVRAWRERNLSVIVYILLPPLLTGGDTYHERFKSGVEWFQVSDFYRVVNTS